MSDRAQVCGPTPVWPPLVAAVIGFGAMELFDAQVQYVGPELTLETAKPLLVLLLIANAVLVIVLWFQRHQGPAEADS